MDNQTEADAQFTDESGFVWWRLVNAGADSGLWVRSDLVAETAGCTSLPVAEISP